MTFNFLHFSDIHFSNELTSSREFRDKIIKRISDEHLDADCLVISGDLFNRGFLDKTRLESYKTFFTQLPGCDCVLVVPGNHDLDRMAQLNEKGSFNVYTTRKSLVLQKGKENSAEEFDLSDDEKLILYNMAFNAFCTFSHEMGFQSFGWKGSDLSAENYEVRVVDVPFRDGEQYRVRFVLLNTALIAGQSIRGDDFRKWRKKLESDYQKAMSNCDWVKAAEKNLEISKLQKRFEDDGEFIIDDEIDGESGRMSLSNAGNQKLSSIRPDGAVLTIFVGHHGFQLLSKETQANLKIAMNACGSGIYLCGHAHEARFRRFLIQQNSYPRDVEQIQAGVMFKDESGFAQYGFNSASFSLNLVAGKLQGVISSHFLINSASQETRWFKEDIPFEFILSAVNPLVEKDFPEDAENNTSKISKINNTTSTQRMDVSGVPPTRPGQGPASTSNIRLSNQINNKIADS